jgi:hypothetical protein
MVLFIAILPIFIKTSHPGQAPTASFTYSPAIPGPGDIITFDASASFSRGGTIVSYTWDFGDGSMTTTTTPIATHSYPIDGDYTVELTVTDNSGLTGVAVAIIQVRTVVFFRVCIGGSIVPLANVQVTAYYNNGTAWVMAPASNDGIQIKYDKMTQPDLANNDAQRNRNPGYTASILRQNASNIGFDAHPSTWTVFFKFQLGSILAYWPNNTDTVHTYSNEHGVETYHYDYGHQAYWDNNAGTYVIKVGDIPRNGVSASENHPIIAGILCPPPAQQWSLIVKTDPSGITTIPGQGLYVNGTNVVLTAPTYVNVSSYTRYKFNYWDVDGASRGSGVNPITVLMNANHTATAHYTTQYYLTVSSARDSPAPTSGWFDNGASITANVTSPFAGSAGTQYICTGWTGTGSVPASGSGATVTFTITQPSNITWNWKTQYYLTVSSAHGTIGGQGWYDNGATAYATVTPLIVAGPSGTQYVFDHWSGDASGTASPSDAILMSGPRTVTANWKTQYYLTVSSAHGTIGGQGWYDNGATAYATVTPLIVAGPSGTQYVFDHWSGDASGTASPSDAILMSGPRTVTANWKTQYYLTVSSARDSPAPTSGWFDNGTIIPASVTSPASGTPGTQYVCTGWTGTGSVPASGSNANVTFTITQPSNITWNWKTQYQVIFDQSGVGSDFNGTVVTIESVNYSRSDLPTTPQFWWDQGSSHNFSFASPLPVNGGKNYVWDSTAGLSSLQSGTLTITGSGNVVGNYIEQNRITFDQTGVGSDFTGTVVTIDGVNYTKSQLPVSFPWILSSNHSFAFQSPLVVGISTKYVWNSTTGLSNLQSGSITVTTYGSIVGNYRTQYYLTASSVYGTTGGQGWYDNGATAYATVTPLIVAGPSGTQYVFDHWSGDASGTASPSDAILMSGPRTATANWKTQCYLTVSSVYGTAGGQGWYDSGAIAYATVTPLTVSGPSGTQYVFDHWSGDASGTASPSDAILMSGPRTVTANWKTQYYLTVSSAHGTIGGQGWYDNGATAYATVTPLIVAGPSGTQYVFDHWSGDASGTASPSDAILMSGPRTATANWKTQCYLTVSSVYGTAGGQGWYDSGAIAYATVTPLTVSGPSGTQYVFDHWSGDASGSTSPSSAIVMSGPKTTNANWKTQYYLTLVTIPSGVDSPSGAGWYDSGASATISTDAFVDIVSGFSRYRFNGWTTDYMPEIEYPTRSPTTVSIDQAKTVTADYMVQYNITFNQSGASPDFTGTIAIIDSINYNTSGLRVSFWWDNSSSHNFAFQSPLVVTANNKQYVWTNTTGLSALQSGTMIVSSSGSVIGNYKTQYYLIVTSPYDSPTPTSGWLDSGTLETASVTSPASGPVDTRYVCIGWTGAGSVPASGTGSSVTFTINQQSAVTWNWKTQYLLTVTTYPGGLSPQPTRTPAGEVGPSNAWWYDASTGVALTAQAVSEYTFNYWDVNGVSRGNGVNPISVTMNVPYTATAYYTPQGPPFTVLISPMSTTILLGQSVPFTSTVSGGTPSYSYQWYVNNNPFPGATSSTWTFTPTAPGTYYVYLQVTDAGHITVQSDTAKVTVMPLPIGGYSIPYATQFQLTSVALYVASVALLGAALSLRKRKRK